MKECCNEVLLYYIADTYINCLGKAHVRFLCSENNCNGSYFIADFNSPNIVYYEDEGEAVAVSRIGSATQTVHFHWAPKNRVAKTGTTYRILPA